MNVFLNKKYWTHITLFLILLLSSIEIHGCPLYPADIKSGEQCVDIGGYQLYIQREQPDVVIKALEDIVKKNLIM